ncbi:hypothetical protein ACSMXM_05460 [Pacificimonas sp. ICDLI1SI03]
MGMDLSDFTNGLDEDNEETRRLVGVVGRRVTLGILRRVVFESPVKEGLFRGNWQASVTQVIVNPIERKDKNGNEVLSQEIPKIEGAPPFQAIWLANNVPYAEKLNSGWSIQAPAGFVEAAIDAELSVFQ